MSNRTPCIVHYNKDTNKAGDTSQIHIATVALCFLPTSRRCNCQYYSINQIVIKILLLGVQSRVYTDPTSDKNLSFPPLSYQFRTVLHRSSVSLHHICRFTASHPVRFFWVITVFTYLCHFTAVFLYFFLPAIRVVFA